MKDIRVPILKAINSVLIDLNCYLRKKKYHLSGRK